MRGCHQAAQGTETAKRVTAALDAEEPRIVLVPGGSRAMADARTIGWMRKETATASKLTPLQIASASQVPDKCERCSWRSSLQCQEYSR